MKKTDIKLKTNERKNEFTSLEKDEIIELIKEKEEDPDRQNQIRTKIRNKGFYYSDFETRRKKGGYTVDDFKRLIDDNKITIKDDKK